MNIPLCENVLPFEAKHFYRRIETILSRMDSATTNEWSARLFLSGFQSELAEVLQISAIHLYEFSEGPQLLSARGEPLPEIGFDLQNQIHETDLPWFGNLNGRFVAVLPFDQERLLFLVFFGQDQGESRQSLCWALTSIHYALIQHSRRLTLNDALEQATAVQLSLLPTSAPQHGEFEIAAKTIPAKIVGGDVYDFQSDDGKTLLLMIADAAGHGLPAALQARDVITGLRMGIEKGIHLTLLAERLNRVIYRSGLVSRFISLVLGELMNDESFLYVNAGHPAPLLLRDQNFIELTSGGMILGFAPDSFYRAGYVRLEPGDLLMMYTDGVIEHNSKTEEEFGKQRLQDWMLRWKEEPLDLAVEDLFIQQRQYGGQQNLRDDATVILVRR